MRWNDLLEDLIECDHLKDFKYCDEFNTIKFLSKFPHINESIERWLKQQNETRLCGSDLAKAFIENGIVALNEKKANDLATDFFTNAMFVAPEMSSEAEIAHTYRNQIIYSNSSLDQSEMVNFKLKSVKPFQPNANLKQKCKSSVGRYIVTSESIEEGELIMKENAYAFVPIYNSTEIDPIFYHCQNCANTDCIPYPCPKCLRVSYCSINCQHLHRNIHNLECIGYKKNLWNNIGIAHLAFRTFIVGFNESLEHILNFSENSSPQRILHELIQINDTNFVYSDVLKLVTNLDKMNIVDIFSYGLTALMLVDYLNQYTHFFKTLPATCFKVMPAMQDWKIYAAAILLRHLGHLVTNAHTMSTIQLIPPTLYGKSYRDKNGLVSPQNIHLVTEINFSFSALFPKTSILNHSCNENARNFFNGKTLKMFAHQSIKQNTEISNSYGPNYKQMPKMERISVLLNRYYFLCKCNVCESNNNYYEQSLKCICSNEDCKSIIYIKDLWWLYLNDQQYITQILEHFICNKCKMLLKLNPISSNEYFEIIKAIDDNNNTTKSQRHKMLDKAVYFYLDAITCLPVGHEFRSLMAKKLLSANIIDSVIDRNICVPLGLIAVDYCKNTKERYGIYDLEYVKSLTYAIYILDLIDLKRKEFKNMIIESLKINGMYECLKILPDSIYALFKSLLPNIGICEDTKITTPK